MERDVELSFASQYSRIYIEKAGNYNFVKNKKRALLVDGVTTTIFSTGSEF